MNDKDWQPHEPVSRTEYVVNLERKVEELETALEETEHDMHMRIRASYDKTIADSWREHVKEIEAERDALAEKLRIKERTIDLMGQFTEKLQKELDDLQENFDKKLKEALANSDACWKLEQKMYVRQRDEARAEVEKLRRERDEQVAEAASWRATARDKGSSSREVAKERDEARSQVVALRALIPSGHDHDCTRAHGEQYRCRCDYDERQLALADTASYAETAQKALSLAQARYTDACDALGVDPNDSLAHRIRMALESARHKYDQKVAEIEMLRGVGCREVKADEPESGPCGVCLKCAEERGARWALERHGNPFATKTLAQYAEDICLDAREKR